MAWAAQEAAVSKCPPPESVPELEAALEQVALSRDIAATIENLQVPPPPQAPPVTSLTPLGCCCLL